MDFFGGVSGHSLDGYEEGLLPFPYADVDAIPRAYSESYAVL